MMSEDMDLALLRQLVAGVVATLGDYHTHDRLGEACERLGLPEPPGRVEGAKRAGLQIDGRSARAVIRMSDLSSIDD